MTVWKDKTRTAWRYKFWYDGRPYQGSTGQLTREDAEEFEANEQRRVRRQAGGLELLPEHSPRITDWAAFYYTYTERRGKVRRMHVKDDQLRVVLRFWGGKPSGTNPKNPVVEGEPYHDLRLIDPIQEPDWIERFEDWIRRRGVGAQTRLHYLSIMSCLYRCAMLAKHVKRTGVRSNPFLTVERDKPAGRTVTLTPVQLRAWLSHAPRHTKLAIAIAALAPKLRLANVLGLRWESSFDPRFEFIRVEDHKTMGITGEPLVVPITAQLRTILKLAQAEATTPAVIAYRDEPVTKRIRTGLKRAAEAAGLTYGRDVPGGVTFHTIRHTAATLLAEVPSLTEAQRAATMGQDVQTTQKYTHLRPVSQRRVLAHLGNKLRLGDVLDQAFGPERKTEVPPPDAIQKPQQKAHNSLRASRG